MPIEITNASELQAIEADRAGQYVVANDIDASETRDWNDGAGFTPITASFSGTLDGNGKTITSLEVRTGESGRCAPFRVVSGTIKDLLLVDSISTPAGGGIGKHSCLCAEMTSSAAVIERCGVVNGLITSGYRNGMVVGHKMSGTVRDCYAKNATINSGGTAGSGGVVGENTGGTFERCFAAGENAIGGQLTGTNSTSSSDCFWDSELGPSTSGGGATGKTTAEMQDIATFTDTNTTGLTNAWDMAAVGSYVDETWAIDAGNDYPILGFEVEAPSGDVGHWYRRQAPQIATAGVIG